MSNLDGPNHLQDRIVLARLRAENEGLREAVLAAILNLEMIDKDHVANIGQYCRDAVAELREYLKDPTKVRK